MSRWASECAQAAAGQAYLSATLTLLTQGSRERDNQELANRTGKHKLSPLENGLEYHRI